MMDTLEMRFYSREEIGVLTGYPDIHHRKFVENVKGKLDRHGYSYKWERGRGVTILDHKLTAENRMALLMRDTFHLSSQINTYQFACYIGALQECEYFYSMPREERVRAYQAYCGECVSLSTMDNWQRHLAEIGVLIRNKDGLTWKLTYDADNRAVREVVDLTSPEYTEYKRDLASMLNKEYGFAQAKLTLFKKYGYYLNKSPEWVLCAWTDNNTSEEINELLRLSLKVVKEHKCCTK